MKSLNAWTEEIKIEREKYSITIIEKPNEYDVYLEHPEYPMRYMFGIQKDSYTPQEVMELAIANAPDYTYMFDEE